MIHRDKLSGLYLPDRRIVHPRAVRHRQKSPMQQLGNQQMMLAQRIAAGGGFTPEDLPSLVRWNDTSQFTGLADNDPVISATDASGNGNHLTQPFDNAYCPLFRTGIANGLPAMQFTQAGFSMLAGAVVSGSSKSWWVAFEPVDISGPSPPWGLNVELLNTGVGDSYYRYESNDGYWATFRATRLDSLPAGVPLSGVHRVIGISTASTWEVWIDGVSQGAQTADFTEGTRFYLGAANPWEKNWNGYVMEVGECNAQISGGNITDLDAYLATKWQ